MQCLLLADDIAPPWNKGEKVLIRNLARILTSLYGDSFKVFLTIRDNSDVNLREIRKYFHNALVIKRVNNSWINTVKLCIQSMLWRNSSNNIIHVASLHYSLATSLIKVLTRNKSRLVIHVYQLESDYVSPWFMRINITAIKLYSSLTDAVCATSSNIRSKLSELGVKSFYLPPAIDTEFYKPKSVKRLRARLNIKEDDIVLLYIGNITPTRFPSNVVLKAVKMLIKQGINIKFLIYAPCLSYNYTYRNILFEKIRNFQLEQHVYFSIEDLTEEEKANIYNIADIFIFPSLKPQAIDPPITVLEAMSCGKIVIASPIQSLTQIINHRINGLLVHPLSKDFYLTLYTVCKDVDSFKNICRNARQTILRNFSFEAVSRRLQILHSMLKS